MSHKKFPLSAFDSRIMAQRGEFYSPSVMALACHVLLPSRLRRATNSFRHDFVVPPPSKREVFKAEIPAREDQANSAQTRLQLVDIMTSYVNKPTEGVKSAFFALYFSSISLLHSFV